MKEDEELDELEKSTNPMIIYHGNEDKDMIPKFGVGKKTNDYGRGLHWKFGKDD